MIIVSWVVEGQGAGESLVADTDEAAAALTAGVRAAIAGLAPDVRASVLHGSLGPVRHQLLTEGAHTLRAGLPWTCSVSGLLVTMARQ